MPNHDAGMGNLSSGMHILHTKIMITHATVMINMYSRTEISHAGIMIRHLKIVIPLSEILLLASASMIFCSPGHPI